MTSLPILIKNGFLITYCSTFLLQTCECVSSFYQLYSSLKPVKRISKPNDIPKQVEAVHLLKWTQLWIFLAVFNMQLNSCFPSFFFTKQKHSATLQCDPSTDAELQSGTVISESPGLLLPAIEVRGPLSQGRESW